MPRVSSLLFLWCLPALLLAARPNSQPNILFIAVDDLNDYVSCLGGHPNGWTPNIDRLAEAGMLFTNAHAAAPVCNPSRIAFLTGLQPSTTGVYHNVDRWEHAGDRINGIAHLPLHFKRQGYRVWMGGKIFHSGPADLDQALDENAGGMGNHSLGVISEDYDHPFAGLRGVHNYAVHWGPLNPNQSAELSDPKIAAWAVEHLSQPVDEPFLLMVGFHRPHTPLTTPAEFWEAINPETLLLPPTEVGDLDDLPWMGRQTAIAGWQEMENGHYRMIKELGVHRDILRGYLAAMAFVDAQIGKVIDALERSPHRDNTIVVLFSDHGWGIGERFHFKKWGLWDDTTRVPLIIRAPGVTEAGSHSDAGVTLLDLYPTLVDLVGANEPAHRLEGDSLKPLLENPKADWQRPALTTYGRGNHALRNPRWRYIRWADGSEELYDHDRDPHEWLNLAGLPRHQDVKRQLSRWLPETNAPAVRSSHTSPVILQAGGAQLFHSVQPEFVEGPIYIRAEIGPQLSDGVILQHGGMFNGYALHVSDGRLAFSLMDIPRPLRWDTLIPFRTTVTAEKPLKPGETTVVEAALNRSGEVRLMMGGELVGQGQVGTLSIHPAGVMQAGSPAKTYPPVGDYRADETATFTGDIREVAVRFGSDALKIVDQPGARTSTPH